MAHCPICNRPLDDDRERVGARCPSCREPLYDPPGRIALPPREGEAACAAHPAMGGIGLCARCGKPLCETCRTRWRGLIVCAACVDRTLSTREAAPIQARAGHGPARRAAAVALIVWLLAGAALFAQARLAVPGDRSAVVVTFVALLVLAANVSLAAFAVGQAVAALSVPAGPRLLPLVGLCAAGVYVALALGLGLLGLR